MASFNKVILAGNITRDPELRVTPKGTPICQFGLAVNRDYKLESGEKREEVTFVDCEAWGKTGELIAKYLAKGRGALIEGRLKLDEWEDKTTHQKRQKLKVVVDQVQFLGGKADAQQSGATQSDNQQDRNSQPQRSPAKQNENMDEDVPF